uniref:Acyl-CoA oxidase C-alpha1 domain-containing protein n=1 Tax=Timema shepardi TaxID=629360 RepID=A0A7R9ARB7_TIMSH|nr:unnamed protein product [Timema shepardi]
MSVVRFIMFQNYRIPRENLLNRTSDVTPEGDYETSFSNPEQQLGAALENLSAGRVGIMQESVATLASAITIAIRYSAVRRQFGPDPDGEELPIIEYEMQQWRLFPYVAAACALRIFIESFIDQYLECVEMSHSGAKLAHLISLNFDRGKLNLASRTCIDIKGTGTVSMGMSASEGMLTNPGRLLSHYRHTNSTVLIENSTVLIENSTILIENSNILIQTAPSS